MIIIFNQSAVGTAACMGTGGAKAGGIRIKQYYNGASYNPLTWAGNTASDAWKKTRDVWDSALSALGFQIDQVGPPGRVDYGETPNPTNLLPYSDAQTNNKEVANYTLNQIIQPLGLVTGISLDYADSYDNSGERVTANSPSPMMGTGTITGVVFEAVCEGQERTPTKGKHGLEGILAYYYNTRVSNNQKNITTVQLQIGGTTIDSWMVGLTVQPQNFDYRIWQWTFKLALTPNFSSSFLKR